MKNNWNLKLSTLFDLLILAGIVSVIYIHTLDRPWIFYDEIAIYDESNFPIPSSFSELIEIIKNFGVVNNLSSSNFLYSSNSVNRINFLDIPIRLVTGLFFQKNAFLYHLLNLLLHILNTSLVYTILKTLFSNYTSINRIIIVLLTLIWSCHPAQVESILLSTNINATLSYSVFFGLFLEFLINKDKHSSKLRQIILPICFLVPMFTNEYIIALPIILFTYSFVENNKSEDIKDSIKISFKRTFPYLTGFAIYSIYFLLSSYKFSQASSFNPTVLFFERVLWLAPQIFFHHLKLIFFPLILSIDQTSFVMFGERLLSAYPSFCLIFLICWLVLPLVLFLRDKRTYWLLITSWLFFLSILPFSQFLSPTYCLSAERYLYTPVFFIILGLTIILSKILTNSKTTSKYIVIFILCLITSLLFVRSYIRTFDWKNNVSLITSTIGTASNDLYKGFRIKLLGDEIQKVNSIKSKEYLQKGQFYFLKAFQYYKNKNDKNPHEPLVLKAYGLDSESLLLKSIHLISFNTFIDSNDDYKKYLVLFDQYSKHLDRFDPRTLELYANLLLKNNDANKAKSIFLYAYSRFPTSPFILMSLIRFEREIEKNLNNARTYLAKGLKLYPYSKELLFESLRYYQLENNLPEYTKHSYLYGLRTHSKFTYHEALTGFLTLGDLINAKKTIDKLLNIDPNDPKTLYLSSSYYIKKGLYEEALTLLNKAYLTVEKEGSEEILAFNITNTIANLYLAMGDKKEALSFANKALIYTKSNSENLNKIKNFINAIGK